MKHVIMLRTLLHSPANNNSPSILGTAEANVTINLYSDASCTSSLATGTVNGSGFFSVSIAVANNTTTSIYATNAARFGVTAWSSALREIE